MRYISSKSTKTATNHAAFSLPESVSRDESTEKFQMNVKLSRRTEIEGGL